MLFSYKDEDIGRFLNHVFENRQTERKKNV